MAQSPKKLKTDTPDDMFRSAVATVKEWAGRTKPAYPVYAAKLIKDAGVIFYNVDVPTHETVYRNREGLTFTDEGFSGSVHATITGSTWNSVDVAAALKRTQSGLSDYPTFMKEIAAAGCERYDVFLDKLQITYSGHGGNLTEVIPKIDDEEKSSDSSAARTVGAEETFKRAIAAVKEWAHLSNPGYPNYAHRLLKAGCVNYVVDVASHQTTYRNAEGTLCVDKGFSGSGHGSVVASTWNGEAMVAAVKRTQAGQTDYPTFMKETAAAGCESYEVFLDTHSLTYSGHGGSYTETIPVVDDKEWEAKQTKFQSVVDEARKFAMANKFTFPQLVQKLKAANVKVYRVNGTTGGTTFYASTGGMTYADANAAAKLKGEAKNVYEVAASFDTNAVKSAIKATQAGEITYPEFMRRIGLAGVECYDAELDKMRVVYVGHGSQHVEPIPEVTL